VSSLKRLREQATLYVHQADSRRVAAMLELSSDSAPDLTLLSLLDGILGSATTSACKTFAISDGHKASFVPVVLLAILYADSQHSITLFGGCAC